MRPTRRLDHAVILKLRITLIPIPLKNAAEWVEGFTGARPSVGAVTIQHRRRRLSGERAVIADIAAQPASAGVPRPGSSTGTVVSSACAGSARHNVRVDGIDQRTRQPSGLAHPVSESGTIELDASARVNLRLTIQRAMIGVFMTSTCACKAGVAGPR